MIRSFRERTRSTSSKPGSFDLSGSPNDVATAPATWRGSVRLSKSTKWTFPPNSSAAARPTAKATVVLPMPPGPSSVTNRSFRSLSLTWLTTVSRPIIMIGRTGSRPWCRNLAFLLSVRSRARHGFKAQHEISRTFARCDSLGQSALCASPLCRIRSAGRLGAVAESRHCLLQYVKSVHRTAENVAAALHPGVAGDSHSVQMVPYMPLSMHFISLDLCFQALQAALVDLELL